MYASTIKAGFFLAIRKKTQGEKNSKLKKKTQTQAKNPDFRHLSQKRTFLIAKNWALFNYKPKN